MTKTKKQRKISSWSSVVRREYDESPWVAGANPAEGSGEQGTPVRRRTDRVEPRDPRATKHSLELA